MKPFLAIVCVTVIVLLSKGGFDSSPALTHVRSESESEMSDWRHYRMDDLDLDVGSIESVRGRYVQTMYDLEGDGSVRSTGFVHLEVDRAVHSGPWDGQYPASMRPWREPGLVVDWKIQNAVYNAFDRVLTDRRFSTVLRLMPAGAYGYVTGATIGTRHSRISTALESEDSSYAVTTRELPHGAVNVLTVPYVLAAMDLEPGDRFTLPGHALIGGPDGTGRRWRGAFEVQSIEERSIRGDRHRLAHIRQWTLDPSRLDSLTGRVAAPDSGQRFTVHVISDRAPYLIGRGDYIVDDEGITVRVREHLDLVDWSRIPLAAAELIDQKVWQVDSTSNLFMLRPVAVPPPIVDRHP